MNNIINLFICFIFFLNSIYQLNNNELKLIFSEKIHNQTINYIDINKKNDTLITASGDKTCKIFSLKNLKINKSIELNKENVNMAIFSPDNKKISLASSDKTLIVLDTTSFKEIIKINFKENVSFIAYSNNGKYLAVASDNNTITILDTEKYIRLIELKKDFFYISGLAFSKDDKYLIAISNGENIYTFDMSTFNTKCILKHNQGYLKALSLKDFSYIFTAGDDGSIKLWNFEKCNFEKEYNFSKSSILSLSLKNKENKLIFGTDFSDKKVKILDLDKNIIIKELIDFNSDINTIATFNDYLIVGTGDGFLKIYKMNI
ncbi:MAG: hypothetical protein U0457_18740 [Candidatus Sericytochromatia bacterium]